VDLAGFTCGDGRIDAEQTVDQIVGHYAAGENSVPTLRVTRELPAGNVVGLVAVEDGGVGYAHPLFEMPDWKDPVYLAVLTLSAEYRGGYTTQDGTPLSHVLLREALQFVAEREEGPIPSVQAIIAPENTLSRRLFEGHGFEMIPTTPELLYVRPRGLAVPGEEAERGRSGPV
jgi:ribosomal protein S18 acetylase RimI-like enzyme